MIGVARYKEDVREAIEAKRAAEAREAAAMAYAARLEAELAKKEVQHRIDAEAREAIVVENVARLEAELAEAKAARPTERVITKEVEKEVVRIAAPANVASSLSGTNAEKIAALEAIVGTLQERLKLAGLEWEV